MKQRIPIFISLALGLVFTLPGMRDSSAGRIASNLLFGMGSGFLVVAIVLTLSNAHMFASASWGTRTLKRLFRGEKVTGREAKDDFLRYRQQRGGHAVFGLYGMAALMLTGSALLSLLG